MASSVSNQVCVVTGGSGFVGRRLVEMLVERGAKRVVSFDLREPVIRSRPDFNFLSAEQEARVAYKLGDISNIDAVLDAFRGADAVFHIAAAVGPFLPDPLFHKVNVVGTQNVIDACRALKIRRLVAASTPSIFFDGNNISGKKPSELAIVRPGHFLARYAETKAVAERLVREANGPDLFTINVAPHQVYGPRDGLFLPNFISARDKLRIMGNGQNLVSFCHTDNYCHGLICGHAALHDKSPCLGKFYLITDGPPQRWWHVLDSAVVRFGGRSLYDKLAVPLSIMYPIAYFLKVVGFFFRTQFRLNPFNVTMLSIDRYFDISDSVHDLKYTPVKTFEQGWRETLDWFVKNEDWAKKQAESTLNR